MTCSSSFATECPYNSRIAADVSEDEGVERSGEADPDCFLCTGQLKMQGSHNKWFLNLLAHECDYRVMDSIFRDDI